MFSQVHLMETFHVKRLKDAIADLLLKTLRGWLIVINQKALSAYFFQIAVSMLIGLFTLFHGPSYIVNMALWLRFLWLHNSNGTKSHRGWGFYVYKGKSLYTYR